MPCPQVHGLTAVMKAVCGWHHECVAMLVVLGADLGLKDEV